MSSGIDEANGAAGSQAGRPALARLVAVDRDRFAESFWGQRPLLTPAEDLVGGFADLLSPDAVDELVSSRGLRTPFLRVAKNGTTLGEKTFTASGGVGASIADQVCDDRLVRLFAEGSTMVLQALHRVWPPVVTFCQQLAAELGHPVQANAYVTPPQNQGFSDHYDVHDVFVLQISGEKRWRIHLPVLEAPLRDQPWTDRRSAVERRAAEPATIDTVLRPGDCLYLPRGYLHAATALGGVSTHLTIGVHSWTRYAVAEQLLAQAMRGVARDPALRHSLHLGLDFADSSALRPEVERAKAALVAELTRVDSEVVAQALLASARGTQRAAPVGPLKQLRDAEAVTPETTVLLRDHLAASLDHVGQRIVLRSRAGDFPVTEEDVAPVKALLAAGSAPAADLGLELTRRLFLAGVATAG